MSHSCSCIKSYIQFKDLGLVIIDEEQRFGVTHKEYLKKLRTVSSLTDEIMADEFRMHMLKHSNALPSIETLMHAFIDKAAVVHTHPTAILALTNRAGGEKSVATALGGENVTTTVEGLERFGVSVRYPRELRDGSDIPGVRNFFNRTKGEA